MLAGPGPGSEPHPRRPAQVPRLLPIPSLRPRPPPLPALLVVLLVHQSWRPAYLQFYAPKTTSAVVTEVKVENQVRSRLFLRPRPSPPGPPNPFPPDTLLLDPRPPTPVLLSDPAPSLHAPTHPS